MSVLPGALERPSQPHFTGLDGAVAIVTGAGRMRSIGRQIAMVLAESGCDVVLVGTGRAPGDRPADEQVAGWEDIDSVADEIRTLGRRALPLVADITDEQSVDEVMQQVVDEFGRIDVVVNNAAAARGADRVAVAEMSADVWDRVIAVNLRGTFLMSRAAVRWMLGPGVAVPPVPAGRSLIAVSSVAGKTAPPRAAAYGASKAAVQSLTVSLARELGADGIRANALCPGVTATGRIDDIDPDGWRRYLDATVPLRRAGDPREVAWAVAYLASEQGAWITGQCWNLDGGQVTMR